MKRRTTDSEEWDLIRALINGNPTALQTMVANLADRGNEGSAIIQRAFARIIRWRQRLPWVLTIGMGTYIALIVILCAFLTYFGYRGVGGMIGGLLGGCAGPLVIFSSMQTGLVNRAVRSLERLDDLRLVGLFAEALEIEPECASRPLRRLLPRIRGTDTALLTRAQQACLCRRLPQANPPLALAILDALEAVGDSEAIPAVHSLARCHIASSPGFEPVSARAREVLAVLGERAERSRASSSLLRVAEAPSQALLRPAGAAGADGGELLRPADNADQLNAETRTSG